MHRTPPSARIRPGGSTWRPNRDARPRSFFFEIDEISSADARRGSAAIWAHRVGSSHLAALLRISCVFCALQNAQTGPSSHEIRYGPSQRVSALARYSAKYIQIARFCHIELISNLESRHYSLSVWEGREKAGGRVATRLKCSAVQHLSVTGSNRNEKC